MTWRAWLAFVALSVIWGVPYFFIKLALEEIPPVGVAWSRIALGAAILLPVAWKRGTLRSAASHKIAICAFAIIELVIPFVLIAQGERWISSSLTGILIATVPLAVVILAPLFGVHESLGPRRLVGLAIGFIGVVALLGIDPVGGWREWFGVGCILVATLGYAIGPLIVERYLVGVDELASVAASLVVGTIVLLPAVVLAVPAKPLSFTALSSIAVLGIGCTALGLWIYFFLIAEAGAARASVVTYVNPAIAALLGVLVLSEPFGVGSAVGFALILFGSWLSTSRAEKRTEPISSRHAAPEGTHVYRDVQLPD